MSLFFYADETIQELLVHGPIYALSRIFKSLLGSSSNPVDGSDKLETIFKNEEYVTDTTVDYLIKKYLLSALKIPEEHKKRKLLEVLDKALFGNETLFVLKLFSRTLIPTIPLEESSEILTFLALKFHGQRNFQKFINLLMSSVEKSLHPLTGFSLQPQLIECLGECAVKLPISQNMSLWNPLCTALGKDLAENEDPEGK